jgi:alanine-glyoxylate transaminase/serine-glyoxylate transaminase/serine-pyruvate transaminase
VRRRLLQEFGIEIGGGLGPLKNRIWRIGLMGSSSSRNNVVLFLSSLERILSGEGFQLKSGAAVDAAMSVY